MNQAESNPSQISDASHGNLVTIREASLADIESIREVAKVVFPATYATIITPAQIDFMMDWMYSPASLRLQMTEEGHVYFIAWKSAQNKAGSPAEGADRVPVGYVSIQPLEPCLWELQKIYVLPSEQGTGLGRQLFLRAVDEIRFRAGGDNRFLADGDNRLCADGDIRLCADDEIRLHTDDDIPEATVDSSLNSADGDYLGVEAKHCLSHLQMHLRVNRNNPAVAFYKKMGMTVLKEDNKDIGQGFYMTDYIMTLDL